MDNFTRVLLENSVLSVRDSHFFLVTGKAVFFCQQHKACTVATEFSSIHSTVKNISLKEIDRGISLSAAVA